MKIYIEKHPANPSYNHRNYALTSYEREFEEQDYPKRSDHTFACALPKDISTLSPSQLVFLYFAYFRNMARIPSQIAGIDFALVDKKQTQKQERINFENEIASKQTECTDKTAELNEKKPQRESTLQTLQAQVKQTQDEINELKKLKKPTQEQQERLASLEKDLPALESKQDTAQKSLQNLTQRLEILARLYDITTGQGLCVDLGNNYPSLNIALDNTENLAYEIPLRKKETQELQKELEKLESIKNPNEEQSAKIQDLQTQINDLNELITQKQSELESNTQDAQNLSPKVESARKDYEQAKKDLDFLEKNPLKIIETPEKSE
ncbi:hypothetical protein [Helicobacter sp. T3_23-1059]